MVLARVRAFVDREETAKRPFCVLAARPHCPEGADLNRRAWEQVRSFFGSLFRETFTPETEIVDASGLFLAFLSGNSKGEVEAALPEIRVDLERHLTAPVRIEWAVFAYDEISLMLQRPV
jgi:hypothetical protein